MFRAGGEAAETSGNGLFFDDVVVDNAVYALEPQSKDDCMDGGWEGFVRADGTDFKNQGDCIQYFNTGK